MAENEHSWKWGYEGGLGQEVEGKWTYVFRQGEALTGGECEVLAACNDGDFLTEENTILKAFAFETGEILRSEANGCLIAAAPELLAACKDALELLESGNPNTYAIERRLRKVIARAGGKEK